MKSIDTTMIAVLFAVFLNPVPATVGEDIVS
jgi:hypothetical protein